VGYAQYILYLTDHSLPDQMYVPAFPSWLTQKALKLLGKQTMRIKFLTPKRMLSLIWIC